jgi:hypothetical protein
MVHAAAWIIPQIGVISSTVEPEHADLVERLRAAPVWLRAALSSAEARVAVAPGEWGAGDIIVHVRAADAILSARVFQILVREGAPLPAFDERAWGELLLAAAIPLDQQVAEFSLRRAELVAVLRSLAPEQWAMAGQHELTGPVTVVHACGKIADHESEHRAQLEGIVRG